MHALGYLYKLPNLILNPQRDPAYLENGIMRVNFYDPPLCLVLVSLLLTDGLKVTQFPSLLFGGSISID